MNNQQQVINILKGGPMIIDEITSEADNLSKQQIKNAADSLARKGVIVIDADNGLTGRYSLAQGNTDKCAEVIRSCGLGSILQCATYCGAHVSTIRKAYENNPQKFKSFLTMALTEKHALERVKLRETLGDL